MTDGDFSKASESLQRSLASRETVAPSGLSDSTPTGSGHFASLPVEFGRFRVLKLLGHGAMGEVYRAFDPEMKKDVALKIPKADLAREAVLWERFQREARAAGDLNHPNICGMYEVSQIGATYFISMEFIDGRPLSDYISDGQSQRKVVGVILKLAAGLAHAHERGIVHRDLKPANVMIDTKGEPKLMDFGLARRLDTPQDVRATQSGMIVGSPAYMSPEQARAEHDKIGPKTDIYGLGVLFYEMLTGSLPFRGQMVVVLGQIATKLPPRPTSLRADVDPQLESLCLKMLAKKQQDRPQSMNEVAQTLNDWLKSDGESASTGNPNAQAIARDEPLSPVKPAATAEKAHPLAVNKQRVTDLLEKHQYGAAIELLEKIINLRDARFEKLVAWARELLPELRATELKMREASAPLCATADKLLKRHDYNEAVKILSSVPVAYRSPELRETLRQATEWKEECDQLERDIAEAIQNADADTLPALIKRLLKLKPKSPSIRKLDEDLRKHGAIKVIAQRRGQRRFLDTNSRLVEPKHIVATVVGIAALFLGVSLLVRNYLAERVASESLITSAPTEPVSREGNSSRGTVAPASPPKTNLSSKPQPVSGAPESPSPKNTAIADLRPPHLELLDELQSDGSKRGLWVSPDALNIYWEQNDEIAGKILFASRSSTNQSFGKAEFLFAGRHPSLSADERTIVFSLNGKLHFATRGGRQQPFERPRFITELQNIDGVKTPSVSADGLRLVWFNSPVSGQPKQFWTSQRVSPTAAWSQPREVSFTGVSNPAMLSWPQLLDGGRTLLCNDESVDGGHRFVVLRRDNTTAPFGRRVNLEPLGIDGVFGRAPRYVPATDELYFLSPRSRQIQIGPDGSDNFMTESEVFRLTAVSRTVGRELCHALSDEATPFRENPSAPQTPSTPVADPRTTNSLPPMVQGSPITASSDIGRPEIEPGDDGVESLLHAGISAWHTEANRPITNWRLDSGVLTNIRSGPDLVSRDLYRDFDLRLEFLLPKGGNSGVYLRGRYELQLNDDAPDLNLKNSCGSIWGQIPILKRAYSGPYQWNELRVRLVGNRVTVVLNGVLIIDSQELQGVTRGALDSNEGDPGPLALQCLAGVKFRKILLKPLGVVTTASPPVQAASGHSSKGPYVNLFNGHDLTGWYGKSRPLDANSLKTAAGRKAQLESDAVAARQAWKVQAGEIIGKGTHANLATVRDYGDFELELEYKVEPNSDGGLFLRGCPQVQIWDAAKNPEGSGGLFNNQHHAKQPLKNADKPPGQWNVMHIKMIGPKVWVTLNGELVTDGVEMEDQYELGGKLVPATGPIALQSYTGKVAYRNIRIQELRVGGK